MCADGRRLLTCIVLNLTLLCEKKIIAHATMGLLWMIDDYDFMRRENKSSLQFNNYFMTKSTHKLGKTLLLKQVRIYLYDLTRQLLVTR